MRLLAPGAVFLLVSALSPAQAQSLEQPGGADEPLPGPGQDQGPGPGQVPQPGQQPEAEPEQMPGPQPGEGPELGPEAQPAVEPRPEPAPMPEPAPVPEPARIPEPRPIDVAPPREAAVTPLLRVRLFAFLSGGLAGSLVNASDAQTREFSLWPSFGGGLGGELMVHPFFAAGLRGRFYSWKPSDGSYLEQRARALDVSVVPRGLLALGSTELYVALPFGLTVDWMPDVLGARAGAGPGFHIAPLLGLRVWGTHVGWFLQGGYAWHWVHHAVPIGAGREADLDFRRGEVVLDTGVGVRFLAF